MFVPTTPKLPVGKSGTAAFTSKPHTFAAIALSKRNKPNVRMIRLTGVARFAYRKTKSSDTIPMSPTSAIVEQRGPDDRPAPLVRELRVEVRPPQREAGVREVQDPGDREDLRDAHCDERVGATDGDAADDRCTVEVHVRRSLGRERPGRRVVGVPAQAARLRVDYEKNWSAIFVR